jgi:stage II sporulation protein D
VYICDDPGHCQAFISRETAKKAWGVASYSKNWAIIEKAVNETKGEIIMYDNKIANPLFHSNSGGKTENVEDVWAGVVVPYLRSVETKEETLYGGEEYSGIVKIKQDVFIAKIKAAYPNFLIKNKDIFKDIEILGLTEGRRVKEVRIANVVLKGTDFRRIFSLRSANFKIERDNTLVRKIENFDKDELIITVLGNGHGVGMSQWGANYLAKEGKSYHQILKYYYKGIYLKNIY